MPRKVYALLVVVGIVVALAPLAVLYLLPTITPQKGDGRRFYEENIIGVRFYPEDYFVRVSEREFVVTKPLSWAEHTFLTWNGYGDFKFTFPAYEPSESVFMTYLQYGFNCSAVREFYKRWLTDLYYEFYDFLLEDDCYRLRKFTFDLESRSWYASLTLLGYFKRLYMEKLREPYYVWILVRFDPDAMRVKIYNAVNQEELDELRSDVKKAVREHPRVAVAIITHYPIWYGFFEEARRNGTYIVALYARDAKDVDWSVCQRIMSEIFSAIHGKLKDIQFFYAVWVLLDRGRIVAVYSDSCSGVRGVDAPCIEVPELFDPTSFR